MRLSVNKGVCWSALLAIGLLAQPAAAETPMSDEARQQFNASVGYMQDPDGARYAAAYQEFLAATPRRRHGGF
jgi:hypothetical protein